MSVITCDASTYLQVKYNSLIPTTPHFAGDSNLMEAYWSNIQSPLHADLKLLHDIKYLVFTYNNHSNFVMVVKWQPLNILSIFRLVWLKKVAGLTALGIESDNNNNEKRQVRWQSVKLSVTSNHKRQFANQPKPLLTITSIHNKINLL
ncbi:MAG: hypothetical protein HC892_10245 [Saprospiraceae bacterium]|nr:hypothetical protein [Saprospiraceae bacterium]